MLVDCQKRGIVGKLTNMYDLYFKNAENNATIVPYMEGDYFPAEVENIIKDIEEGKVGKKSTGKEGKKKKGDKKQKRKSGRGGTRSSGIDEDALKASGIQFPGKDQKSLEEGGRDFVMVKLGETIQPMKESFIVAHLAWKGAKREDMIVPKAIQEYREKHNIVIEDGPEESYYEEEKEKTLDVDGKTGSNEHAGKRDNEDAKDADDSKIASSKDSNSAGAANVTNRKKDGAGNYNQAGNPEGAHTKAHGEKKEIDADVVDGSALNKSSTADVAGNNGSLVESEKKAKTEDCKNDSSNEPIKMEIETSSNGVSTADDKLKKSEDTVLGKKNTSDSDDSGLKPKTEQTGINKDAATVSNSNKTGEDNTTVSPMTTESSSESKVAVNRNSSKASTDKEETSKSTLSMEERSGKFAAMAKKRGISGEEKNEDDGKQGKAKAKKEKPAEAAPVIYVLDSKGRRVKVIDDDAEEMDCEFLNNRQAFLNLCQGNHYQFDHLRRAKHSSMMVLWHLHNRDAPKFVQQCTTCSREILQGHRFHCPICADFDQCQDCVQNPNIPRHPHQLKPIAVSGQQTELTDAQRKERQRSIQLHMTLLQHAATCNSQKCPSANCTKMKGLLKHGAQCKVKAAGGCNVCKRIWALLQIHARQCKATQCPVPNCMAIRERVRQLKKQQQAMDDRRRQEMNRVYRGAR